MSTERNKKLERLFEAVFDLDPGEREDYLDRACASTPSLRGEIDDLLQAHRARTLPFLKTPIALGQRETDLIEDSPSLNADGPENVGLPQPGDRVSRYEILRFLGRGGMGAVYLARESNLDRLVAVKFLLVRNPDLRRRFVREARLTARCVHENIVVIHHADEHHGHPYLVLEYLEGQTLRQWSRQNGGRAVAMLDTAPASNSASGPDPVRPRLEPRAVLEIMVPVARALVRAHQSDIVHRDLKPENIIVTRHGTVKVLDFGLAKILAEADVMTTSVSQDGDLTTTRKSAIIGTMPYMSPEQWGVADIDERSDIWAVGIMLYELLAGRHPLSPLSATRLIGVADLSMPMPSIAGAMPELGKLGEVIDRCLIKHRDDRIGTAAELLTLLEIQLTESSWSTSDLTTSARMLLARLYREWVAFGKKRGRLLERDDLEVVLESLPADALALEMLEFVIASLASLSAKANESQLQRHAEWLQGATSAQARKAVIAQLASDSQKLRLGTIRLLHHIRYRDAVPAVDKLLLREKDTRVQRAGLEYLAAIEAPVPSEVADVLATHSTDWSVRVYSLSQLPDAGPTCLLISDGSSFAGELEQLASTAGYRVVAWQFDAYSRDSRDWPVDALGHCDLVVLTRGEHYAQGANSKLYDRLSRYVLGGGVLFASSWVCWETREGGELDAVLPFRMRGNQFQEDTSVHCHSTADKTAQNWFPAPVRIAGSVEFLTVQAGTRLLLESSEGHPVPGYREAGHGVAYYLSACEHSCMGNAVSPLAQNPVLESGLQKLFAETSKRRRPRETD